MKLSTYIKRNDCKRYQYVGTIWGSEFSGEVTKDDLLTLLEKFPEFDGVILESHPAYGLPYSSSEDGEMEQLSGYFPECSGKIIYANKTQEVVLVEVQEEDL